MGKETFITKKITNQDIYDILKGQGAVQEETLEHAKLTNGRVTNLEKKSIGVWIHKYPFRFTSVVLVVLSLTVPTLRTPLFTIVKSLF